MHQNRFRPNAAQMCFPPCPFSDDLTLLVSLLRFINCHCPLDVLQTGLVPIRIHQDGRSPPSIYVLLLEIGSSREVCLDLVAPVGRDAVACEDAY